MWAATTLRSEASERIRLMKPSGDSATHRCGGHSDVVASAARTTWLRPKRVKAFCGWSLRSGRSSGRGRLPVRIAGTASSVRSLVAAVFRNQYERLANEAKLG